MRPARLTGMTRERAGGLPTPLTRLYERAGSYLFLRYAMRGTPHAAEPGG